MTFLSTLALLFGVVGGFASIPQIYKIFKRKSAKDISIITYAFFFVSSIVWSFYGLEIAAVPIITVNVLSAISISVIMIGWFLYGREK